MTEKLDDIKCPFCNASVGIEIDNESSSGTEFTGYYIVCLDNKVPHTLAYINLVKGD